MRLKKRGKMEDNETLICPLRLIENHDDNLKCLEEDVPGS